MTMAVERRRKGGRGNSEKSVEVGVKVFAQILIICTPLSHHNCNWKYSIRNLLTDTHTRPDTFGAGQAYLNLCKKTRPVSFKPEEVASLELERLHSVE